MQPWQCTRIGQADGSCARASVWLRKASEASGEGSDGLATYRMPCSRANFSSSSW